jgi:hypothetical protein
MKTSSAKDKGRRLQQWACKQISKLTGIPWGPDEAIASREMGQNGVDVRLVGEAQSKFPFSVECKNCETWSFPSWIRQAEHNRKTNTDWIIIAKRNYHKPVVMMDAKRFFHLLASQGERKKCGRGIKG